MRVVATCRGGDLTHLFHSSHKLKLPLSSAQPADHEHRRDAQGQIPLAMEAQSTLGCLTGQSKVSRIDPTGNNRGLLYASPPPAEGSEERMGPPRRKELMRVDKGPHELRREYHGVCPQDRLGQAPLEESFVNRIRTVVSRDKTHAREGTYDTRCPC